MFVIFGLGNPGKKYEGTRHNAGVETLEKLAASYQKKLVRRCFSSYRKAEIMIEDKPVRLIFPLTYMNSSGDVVKNTVEPGDKVIVIVDQMDLPAGHIRLRNGGSSAGHNGLKSMLASLSDNFIRMYIGVGRPESGVSVVEHVLQRPSASDRILIDKAENVAIETLINLIKGEKFEVLMQRANSYKAECE